jgi:hypothetical protein
MQSQAVVAARDPAHSHSQDGRTDFGVEKSYGQKGALVPIASQLQRIFHCCVHRATDSLRQEAFC